MPTSPDITTDKRWIDEQVDRLLGFECLNKALRGDPTPIPAATLADKIGVNKGYANLIISRIANQ